MSKKNIIILSFAIIILIVAIAIYFYANSLRVKDTNTPKTNYKNEQSETKSNSNFYFYNIDGKKYNLDNFSGKPIIMLFWRSDEENSYDMINLLETYYEENKDLVNFLAINVKEPDLEIIENVKAVNFKIPMYFDTDSTVENQYNFENLPHILFIEKNGTIAKEFDSSISEDEFTANLDLLEEKY